MHNPLTLKQCWKSKILWAVTVYFWVCGLSAIFYPISWLFVAGLPISITNELSLAFAVAGTFMLTLGVAGMIAAINPDKQLGLIAVLTVAHAIDALVTLRAVVLGQLPLLAGGLFILVALTWTALLAGVLWSRDAR